MSIKPTYDLQQFLPYLLHQAAEATSLSFQSYYKDRYGMLRTEWRVIFHLARYGDMTAKDICDRAGLHKTKVSRAVAALEEKRFLTRQTSPKDRRRERLSLTPTGQTAVQDLDAAAQRFDANLCANLTKTQEATLRDCLEKLARL